MLLKTEIFRLFLTDDYSLSVEVNIWILGGLTVLIMFFLLWKFKFAFTKAIEINEIELGLGNQKIKLKPNYLHKQIAHKLWVELNTRKIGLEIDVDHDVIVEIYNSWYEFFRISRELVKEIPIQKIERAKETQTFVDLSIEVLNKGLRPHLTVWQAKFRRWYELELKKDEGLETHRTPQEIQRTYDDFDALVDDLVKVNQRLIEYKNTLRKIAWRG